MATTNKNNTPAAINLGEYFVVCSCSLSVVAYNQTNKNSTHNTPAIPIFRFDCSPSLIIKPIEKPETTNQVIMADARSSNKELACCAYLLLFTSETADAFGGVDEAGVIGIRAQQVRQFIKRY